MAFAGFNRGRKNTISEGDWDRDGVKNRRDCDAMNWKRQDGGEVMGNDQVSEHNRKLMKGYAPGEYELIKERLEMHRLKKKLEKKQ